MTTYETWLKMGQAMYNLEVVLIECLRLKELLNWIVRKICDF